MICKIGVDTEVAAGGYDKDIVEVYKSCTCSVDNRKSGSLTKDGEKGTELTPGNEINLSVVPNPVTGNSEIRINGLQHEATLVVYNSTGAKVMDEPIGTSSYSRLVSNTALPAGIYLVILNQNGTVTQTLKMVVVK